MKNYLDLKSLLPILFSFFVMGFVDVVGIATSYVKVDFNLSDLLANLLPMLAFLWFAIFSLPTGIAMNKFGRKQTVLFSAVVTSVAMLIPLFSYSFPTILLAFALLGIGNTILQVSLNPLLTNVVPEGRVASVLTFGQFIKAICSFLGPIIVGIAATQFGNWRLIFAVYAFVSVLSFIWLLFIPIKREPTVLESKSFSQVLALLKNNYTLLLFSVIVLIVGFEVGLMTTVPKYLKEQYDLPLERGAYACSLYFIARTIGTFLGAILLAYFNPKKILLTCMTAAILFFIAFLTLSEIWMIFASLFMVGLVCANVFAIVFVEGLQRNKQHANEISALMIMGVAGGALIPPLMGLVADISNQWTSLLLPFACLVYITVVAFYMQKKHA